MTSELRRPQTIPSLDGFRAIAVMIVVVAHAGYDHIIPGGFGVTIFFFLSGYLITNLMLSEQQATGCIDIPKFYARRFFRLIPPLLITLLIAYSCVAAGILLGRISLGGLTAQLLYFANYYTLFWDTAAATVPAGTGILWSLAVEEHYYILYPLFMYLVFAKSLSANRIGAILVMVCCLCLLWRIYLVQVTVAPPDRTYYASDTRLDSIVFGCLLALWANPMKCSDRSSNMTARHWIMLFCSFCILLLTLVYRDPAFRETYRYSLQGIALFPIFYLAIRFSDNPLFRHLNSKWIEKLGVLSYGIYLIHFVIINLIEKNAPGLSENRPLVLAAAVSLSIIYALGIDYFVDPYFRKLRRQLNNERESRATT